MGRISFSLYLFHELFTEWVMVDTYFFFLGQGNSQNASVWYSFAIYTPIIIFLSWLLTICVDAPAKDFAYNLDIQSRIERPKPKSANQDEAYY